ncbi:MAG TPA: LCP family protein [Micromonosporaceae bacterium]|jgi:anionic cell wall polymer biosynthesis LytR-Cps2A-Psr (LCP) family protein
MRPDGTTYGRSRPGDEGQRRRPLRTRPTQGQPKSPLWAKLVIAFGVLVMVGSGLTVIVPKLVAHWALSNTPTVNAIPTDIKAPDIKGPINFLLLGSDTRDSGGLSDIANADSIVLVHIPAAHNQVYMISLPRDLYVPIARDTETCADPGTHQNKINSAFGAGARDDQGHIDTSPTGRAKGANLMLKTISCIVQDTGGLKFNGWATVNFDGFDKVVAAIGTVHMCTDTSWFPDQGIWSIHYYANGKQLPNNIASTAYYNYGNAAERATRDQRAYYKKGCMDLKPWQALDLSRQRVQYSVGDYGRQQMQQRLLKAIVDKIASPDTLTNLATVARLQQATTGLMVLDLGGIAVENWAVTLSGLRADDVIMVKTYAAANGTPNTANVNGSSVVLLKPDLVDLLHHVQNDSVADFLTAHPDWLGGS